MSERAPYSRVYWVIPDDEKFVTIFDNDANLAAWLRLLLIADQAYPASGALPANCRKSAVKALCEADLIEVSGSRFRVKGLEAERERRSKTGPKSDPDGPQKPPKNLPQGNTDKTRRDETSLDTDEARDPADIYWQLTGRFPVEKALSWIDSLTAEYGAEPTIEALVGAHLEDKTQGTLLGRTRDRLAARARQLDLKERAEEKRRLAEKRAKPRVDEPWRAEYRAAIEQQYRDLGGAA